MKLASEFGNDTMMPHFMLCTDLIYDRKFSIGHGLGELLETMFLTKMIKYKVKSCVFTKLFMGRINLITKEEQKKASLGSKNYPWSLFQKSINDDLESLLIKILKNEEIEDELEVHSFFLPKLPREELKLIKAKDENYLNTYLVYHAFDGEDPDVDEEEMKKSKSKDRYIFCECFRQTLKLTLDSNQCSSEDENSDHLSAMFAEPIELTRIGKSRKRKRHIRGPDFGSETESEKDSNEESEIDIMS